MTRIDKTIEKINIKPFKKDIKYKEAEVLLLHLGFEKRSGKGDHVVFYKKDMGMISIDSGQINLPTYSVKAIQDILIDLENKE